jgi:hypothetical protein
MKKYKQQFRKSSHGQLNRNAQGYYQEGNFNNDENIFTYNTCNSGIENLIIEGNTNYNNTASSFENYIQKDGGNNNEDDSDSSDNMPTTYDNILKLGDRIEEESIIRLKGLFTNIILSQNGSRILQKCLKKTDKAVLSNLLDEILPNLQKMLCNPCANVFCQKLYAALEATDRKRFLNQIKTNIVELSKNKIGFKTVHLFVDLLDNPEDKQFFIECIKDNIVEMCYVSFILIF